MSPVSTDTKSPEASNTDPVQRARKQEFNQFCSKAMDVAVPVGMLGAVAYLIEVSSAPWTTFVLALLWSATNVVVSIKVRRARSHVGLHIGLARLTLAFLFVPAIVYSTGGADLAWIIAMPLVLVLNAYFPTPGRIAVSAALIVASLIPHHMNRPAGDWDLAALVILSVTAMFSVPLWDRLEHNFFAVSELAAESTIIAQRKNQLLRHQRRLLQGLIISGLTFVTGVIVTLVVYGRLQGQAGPEWTELVHEQNLLMSRLWLFLGSFTSLAFASLVYTLFRDRGQLETMVHMRTWELEEANQAIAAANQAKSLFLANTSHEIRTPMNGVIGTTDILLADETDPEKREFLEIIRSCGESMMTIIDDILDLSRIESGKLRIDARDFDVHASLETVLRSMQSLAEDAAVRLSLERDDSVPRYVCADEIRLRQILVNLMSNAIKFSAGGEVHVRAWAEREHLYCEVRDTGMGIAPENMERLFQAFEQADATTTRRFGGAGLGLAICKQLSVLLGGDIEAESDPGKGSVFRFHIAYQPASDDSVPASDDSTPAPDDSMPARGTVLLAEDNLINQKVARRLLNAHFERVLIACDGQEALAMALEHEPDMIFMDVHMPGTDGLEATRRLHETPTWRRVPVIALTASALAEDQQRCIESGMDDFVSKPMRATELAAIVQRHRPTT